MWSPNVEVSWEMVGALNFSGNTILNSAAV